MYSIIISILQNFNDALSRTAFVLIKSNDGYQDSLDSYLFIRNDMVTARGGYLCL